MNKEVEERPFMFLIVSCDAPVVMPLPIVMPLPPLSPQQYKLRRYTFTLNTTVRVGTKKFAAAVTEWFASSSETPGNKPDIMREIC